MKKLLSGGFILFLFCVSNAYAASYVCPDVPTGKWLTNNQTYQGWLVRVNNSLRVKFDGYSTPNTYAVNGSNKEFYILCRAHSHSRYAYIEFTKIVKASDCKAFGGGAIPPYFQCNG